MVTPRPALHACLIKNKVSHNLILFTWYGYILSNRIHIINSSKSSTQFIFGVNAETLKHSYYIHQARPYHIVHRQLPIQDQTVTIYYTSTTNISPTFASSFVQCKRVFMNKEFAECVIVGQVCMCVFIIINIYVNIWKEIFYF